MSDDTKEAIGGLMVCVGIFILLPCALVFLKPFLALIGLIIAGIGEILHGKGSGPMRGGF